MRQLPFAALESFVGGLLAICFVWACVRPVSDPDYWWHLREGAHILENRALRSTDPSALTFTYDDYPNGSEEVIWPLPRMTRSEFRGLILTNEWGSEVIFALVYSAGGHAATVYLAVALGVLALALAFGSTIRRGVPPAIACLAASLAIFTVGDFTVARPHMFTYVLAPVFMAALASAASGRRWAYAALGAIAVLWSNLHGGWLIGFLCCAAVVAGAIVDRLTGRQAGHLPRVVSAVAVSMLGFACNPNDYRALSASLGVMGSYFASQVNEWQRPTPGENWAFFALLAAGVLSTLFSLYRRRCPAATLFLVAGFGAIALTGFRHVPLFLLLALPPALEAAALAGAFVRVGRRVQSLALALTLVAGGLYTWQTRPHVLVVDEVSTPVGAVAHVNQLQVPGPVFNSYDYGGYLLYALEPERPVFIDGRCLSRRAFWELKLAEAATKPVYPTLFDRWGINVLVLKDFSPLVAEVSASNEWTLTYVGPSNSVFVRTKALQAGQRPVSDLRPILYLRQAQLVAGDDKKPAALRAALLAVLYARLDRPDDALRFTREAIAASSSVGEGGRQARRLQYWVGRSFERAGRAREAAEVYALAGPEPRALGRLAAILEESGAPQAEVVLALKRAVDAGSCESEVHDALDRLAGGPSDAAGALAAGIYARALRAASQLPVESAEAAFFRGTALLKLCRYPEAQLELERSTSLFGGRDRAPVTVLSNLAWSMLDRGDAPQARTLFEAILARSPSPDAIFGAGLSAKFAGDPVAARSTFERYLVTASSDDPWAAVARANLEEIRSLKFADR